MLPDVGFGELLVVMAAAVLLVKPEEMPALMHKLGVFTAHMRRFVGGMWAGWREKKL